MNKLFFIPFVLLLFGLSLILTYFITSKAYSPIQKLTQLIRIESDTDTNESKTQLQKNEFDFLESAYQKLISDNQIASELITKARPDLEKKLFSDILNGKEYSCQELEQYLNASHSKFQIHEKYQVFLLQLQNASTDALSSYVSSRQLQQLIQQLFHPEWGNMQLLSPQTHECLMVVQYPADTSIAQIKHYIRIFSADLTREAKACSLNVLLAQGKIYNSLPEILSSCHDASEQMRYQVYYQNEEHSEKPDAPDAVSREYFSSLIRQIERRLGKGEAAAAETLLTRVLAELFVSTLSFEDTGRICEQLLEVFVEKTVAYHINQSPEKEGQYPLAYQKLRSVTDKSELEAFMKEETGQMMQALQNESRKRQHQLIAQAKEYISNNYDNCDLSINIIASNVGCTASYLSNIFTEYTSENLVSYLNTYRIRIAQDLLVNSRILIKDVGFKTGFNTVQNFNRVFKKTTGMTPNEYRKAYGTTD